MNIGRQAMGGRNWEGFGADPFLSGEASYETILGLQVCAMHIFDEKSHAELLGVGVECWSASLRKTLY